MQFGWEKLSQRHTSRCYTLKYDLNSCGEYYEDYRLYSIYIRPLQESYMVSSVYYTDEIAKVLNQQYQGPGKPLLYLLHGLNTDSNNFSKPADFEVISFSLK